MGSDYIDLSPAFYMSCFLLSLRLGRGLNCATSVIFIDSAGLVPPKRLLGCLYHVIKHRFLRYKTVIPHRMRAFRPMCSLRSTRRSFVPISSSLDVSATPQRPCREGWIATCRTADCSSESTQHLVVVAVLESVLKGQASSPLYLSILASSAKS